MLYGRYSGEIADTNPWDDEASISDLQVWVDVEARFRMSARWDLTTGPRRPSSHHDRGHANGLRIDHIQGMTLKPGGETWARPACAVGSATADRVTGVSGAPNMLTLSPRSVDLNDDDQHFALADNPQRWAQTAEQMIAQIDTRPGLTVLVSPPAIPGTPDPDRGQARPDLRRFGD